MLIINTILLTIGVFCVLMLIKNEVTYRRYSNINHAIFRKQVAELKTYYNHNGDKKVNELVFSVNYSDKASYFKTLFRLWDWGYTRILPKDKFELVKKYIK